MSYTSSDSTFTSADTIVRFVPTPSYEELSDAPAYDELSDAPAYGELSDSPEPRAPSLYDLRAAEFDDQVAPEKPFRAPANLREVIQEGIEPDVPRVSQVGIRNAIDFGTKYVPNILTVAERLIPGGKEFAEGVRGSAAEMAAGMTTPKSAAIAPAFAVPVLGEALAMKMGAEALGAGAGRSYAALEQGNPRELGAGLVETVGGAGMLIPGAAMASRRTAKALEDAKNARTEKAANESQQTQPQPAQAEPVASAEAVPGTPRSEAPTGTEIDQVAAMPHQDFVKWARQQKGGYTTKAYELGEKMQTPEGAAKLRELEAQTEAARQAAFAAGDIEAAMNLANKKQFFTEALESAVGVAKNKSNLTPEQVAKAKAAPAGEVPAPKAEMPAEAPQWNGQPLSYWKEVLSEGKTRLVGGPFRTELAKTLGVPDYPNSVAKALKERIASEELKNSPPDLVQRLEQIRDRFDASGDMGKSLSLPHPEAFKAIGKSVIYTAVDLAIQAVKAGRAIGDAINLALDHVRKNHKGALNEKELRANLDYLIANETKPKGAEPKPDVSGETQAMRKSAERATRAPEIPADVRSEIAAAPESKYTQQSMERVEDAVGSMTEAELGAITKGSDLYTAAQLERANRLFKAGRDVEGYNVFADLEKEGTRLGQLINQFKLLKTSRPEDVVNLVNRKLMAKGRDALTPTQAIRVKDAATTSKAMDRDLSQATEAWQKAPTEANAAAAEAALDAANASAVELQQLVSKFEPKSTPQIIKTILQGNLLTPISEVANVFGNMSFAPFRAGSRAVASGLDIIDAAIRNRKREITVQPGAGAVEAAKGAVRGAKQIPSILKEGQGSIKGEPGRGLHPIRAWIDQFVANPDRPTTGGKLTLTDRANMLIEGTLGVPAETMLRGLGAGDAPFRQAAQSRVIAEQLKLKGVPRDQWGFAQKFPELFLDRATRDLIRKETNEAIFQRDSNTLNHITNWIRGKGDWFDLAVATVAPYKLTPWNIVGEILSYNPAVALGLAAKYAKAGNTRSAKVALGKFVTGSVLTASGYWLYKNGLLAPSLDERDESQKARVLSGQVMPPNHINISGLKRALEGESPAFKAGDETVDIYRAGGLAGSIFYMVANVGRDLERNPEATGGDLVGSILRQSTLEQARFGLNQSYLSGVEGILTAIKDGNPDNYIRQWLNTVSSIPIPNTLSALGRTQREYKPDFKAEGFSEKVSNLLKNKTGATGDLPLKRDFWGQPIRETPEGRNAIVYQLFDITKNRQVTDDPVALELFRLWRKTADADVIPSLPKRSVTYGKQTFEMTPEQFDRFSELVGKQRRQIMDAVAVNSNFYAMPDEQKVTLLKRVYDRGMEQGKTLFRQEFPDLKKAPTPAGF